MTDSVSERYIAMVTLVVPDYNEAIDWYVDVSGLQLIEDTTTSTRKRWAVVSPGSGCDVLLANGTTKSQHASIGNQAEGRVSHFLYTRDCLLNFCKDLAKWCVIRARSTPRILCIGRRIC